MSWRMTSFLRGDAMDDYLASLALVRKQIAADETSLFRAASEQIYGTQKYHQEMHDCCISYINRNLAKFENFNQVRSFIVALAILYRRDFLIYQEIMKPPLNATNFAYPRKVVLCEAFGNHFDCVYPRTFHQKAAICQSIVYEIFYKSLFKMDTDVAAAVGLIRKQNLRRFVSLSPLQVHLPMVASPPFRYYEPEPSPFPSFMENSEFSFFGADGQQAGGTVCEIAQPPSYYHGAPVTALPRRMTVSVPQTADDEMLQAKEREMVLNGPPFPYRVAKALDPVVYRNIEYDVWLDDRKARFRSVNTAFKNGTYAVGSNCRVRLDDPDRMYDGIVQELDPVAEMAVVFLPELGERKRVHFDRVQGGPRTYSPSSAHVQNRRGRSRNRHRTWGSAPRAPQSQTNASLSWPATGGTDTWKTTPPPAIPFTTQDTGATLTDPSLRGDIPLYMGDVSFAPDGPISIPAPLQGPLMPYGTPPDSLESYPLYSVPMPTLGMHIPMPPPNFQQFSYVRPPPPTEQDITILRQFYELGGCEYFRQFLTSNQNVMRPPWLNQQLNPAPIVISPQQAPPDFQPLAGPSSLPPPPRLPQTWHP